MSSEYLNVNNPYSNIVAPDPSNYAVGKKSKQYQADLNEYNHQLEMSKFDAELAIMADDRRYAEEIYNKYNSPAAQARQLRSAGINPNIAGLQSSGMSAPQSSLPSSGVPNMNDSSSSFAYDFIMALPQAISMFTNVTSSLQGLQQNNIQLRKEVDNLALGELSNFVPTDAFSFNQETNDNSFDWASHFDDNALSYLKSVSKSHYGRRIGNKVYKAIKHYVGNGYDSLKDAVYRHKYNSEKSRQDFIGLLGNYGYSIDDDVFIDTVKEFNNISKRVSKFKNTYDNDYWSKRSGTDAATADNLIKEKSGKIAENDLFVSAMARANQLMDSNNRSEKTKGVFMYIALLLAQIKFGVSN